MGETEGRDGKINRSIIQIRGERGGEEREKEGKRYRGRE